MIDLGLDVAWDMLIGTALVLSGLAMRRRSKPTAIMMPTSRRYLTGESEDDAAQSR